ncbi:hypothetical protein [Aquimarina sp. 2201CG5-10]|uniref:hypothetical protein n=1 Tax=Aquimarina callyspongiae TaxID=3098150 RepID=UPI002AB56F42|nr:hypothetical protein [Aquimarina sp. 2201CG5-10]MDY8135854.1 hypothetical protein [Aquimarina sp. 2201CG5-10]
MAKSLKEEDVVHEYELNTGKVFFYKDYLIIEVAEGVCFNHEKAKELSKLTNLHFKDRPFGYISNRINSYSVEPTDYIKIKEVFPNIKAFAIVTYNDFQKTSVRIENMFFQGDIVSFDNLENAVDWVKEQI